MTSGASTTTFGIVFALFVLASLVLVVLTLRFLVGQARSSRARWLEGQQGAADPRTETPTPRTPG